MEPGWTKEQRAPQFAGERGRADWQDLGGHRPSHSQAGNAWAIDCQQLLLQVTDDLR